MAFNTRAMSNPPVSTEAEAAERFNELPYGEKEALREMDPRNRKDMLVSAVAALATERQPAKESGLSRWVAEDAVCYPSCGALFDKKRAGRDEFLAAPQEWRDAHPDHTRRIVATAVSRDGGTAFCCFQDEHAVEGRVVGIWAAKGGRDGRIAQLHPFRQLAPEERAARFKDPEPPHAELDCKQFMEPSELPPDEEGRSQRMYEVAAAFDGMYARGTTEGADGLLAEHVESFDLLLGGGSATREDWVAKHSALFRSEGYQRFVREKRHSSSIAAASSSNKAFVHWAFHGERGNEEHDMSGMNMLVFDVDTLKITHIVGFRTPSPEEVAKLFKEGEPLDKTGAQL